MRCLTSDYNQNVALMNDILHVDRNFDVLSKKLKFADGEITLYYIDGFVKDSVMQKLMIYFLSIKDFPVFPSMVI